MPVETTYTQARAELASLLDRVTQDREIVIIRRRNARPVAMVAAEELESLIETVYLLRSPRNAERLLTALAPAEGAEGQHLSPAELAREVGPEGEHWWAGGRLPARVPGGPAALGPGGSETGTPRA